VATLATVHAAAPPALSPGELHVVVTGDRVTVAGTEAAFAAAARGARFVVLSSPTGNGVVHQIFAVQGPVGASGSLTGTLAQTVTDPSGATVAHDMVSLLDGAGAVIGTVEFKGGVWQDVVLPTVILTSGDDTRALIFPVDGAGSPAALASGAYRLDFALDRPRVRSDAPDAVTNYRDHASLPIHW
jgi:hypothetical protein